MKGRPVSNAEPRSQPAKVVMMVGNDIAHDTRVLKMGLALADAGVDVTLLGYASSGQREDRQLGPVRILRVPIQWRLKEAARARETARRHTPNPARLAEQRQVVEVQVAARRRELESAGGARSCVRLLAVRGRRFVARGRSALGWRSARARRELWRGFYGSRSRMSLGARWRRDLPEIDDYELAFGPVLDHLDWDVLHAHDIHLVGVAARAVARRRSRGLPARWVYDAHEYVAGLAIYGNRTVRLRAAHLDLEKEYIREADAVITVSDVLAQKLQRSYRLSRSPAVVLNCPVVADARPTPIREKIGLPPELPLLVFSGGINPVRSVDTIVRALALLPGAHLAIVVVPNKDTPAARELERLAREVGVADRVHVLDPVRPSEVVGFLRGADIGVIANLHVGNHEVALANKLFEYLQAGLALLVSDCEAQRDFVDRHQLGEVFLAGDAEALAAGARAILGQLPTLRKRIVSDADLLRSYSWEAQATVERDVYRSLLGVDRVPEPQKTTALSSVQEAPRPRDVLPVTVGIAPANSAGQAWAWAKALECAAPRVATEVVAVASASPLQFPCDELVPKATFAKDGRWAQDLEIRTLESWTHALLESGRSIFGYRNGPDFQGDAQVLRGVGVEVGLVFHGSDIRCPERHASRNRWSPFRNPADELTAALQSRWELLDPLVRAFDGPKFVSTLDLLVDVPDAVWLPVVVDTGRWATEAPVMERKTPVVVHAPSNANLKGTAYVDEAMRQLEATGAIEYRRVDGLGPEHLPSVVADADIVIDQLAIGSYGVFAAEAMAAGRVVVGHVMDEVREQTPVSLPIVEATGDTLGDVIRGLLADRDRAVAAASAGPAYVDLMHSGARSAAVLIETLGLGSVADSLSA